MAIENLSQDLADLLATKNFEVKYTDGQGKDSAPAEAKTFAFDWIASSGKNYGTVVIVLGDDSDLQMFFGDNLGRTMEDPQDKLDWQGSERHLGFLGEISQFATSHGLGTFSPKDINQLKHTMQGMAAIKEGLFEGYYGTRKVSYVGKQTEARLVIKHNRMIGEDDKRYRYVESLFIETAEGERFKLPFVKLSGGRAMLEHVKQGGRPYDIRGQHINEIVSEMAVLSRFNRASQQRVFEGVTQELVETVHHYYSELRESLQHMATGRGYNQYFESWTPADIGDETALVEDLKTMFIEQTLDARIEAALPTLAKIQQRGNAMKEAEIFENWANQIMEGTWALPDTPEAQAKLDELMSQELIVGPDATNAKEQLYDVIGDDKLFDILADLAEQDPRANCWDDTDVQARLQELGIQMNTTPDAEQDVAEDQLDEIGDTPAGKAALTAVQNRAADTMDAWSKKSASGYSGTPKQVNKATGAAVSAGNRLHGFGPDRMRQDSVMARDALRKQGMAEANIQPTGAASRSHIGNLSNPVVNSVVHPSSGKEIGLITQQPNGEYYAHPSSTGLAHSQGATFATKDEAHQFIRNAHAKAIKNGTLSDRWAKQQPLPQFAKGQGMAGESSENKYSNLSNRGVNRGINRAADDFDRMMDLDQVESPHYKTQHQQATKQRLKTRPMAGPKGVLPEQGVAEGYQLDEGAIETITALAKKIPGIGKYYQMAQQYKPQLIEILKTSKSGKEVKQKMEQLAAGQSATVTESGMMKQLGGLAVGGGSILSTMWMNAMGMIDGVLAHAAAGEVGGAVASGSILGLIPVTLMLFAAMLMFKGSNQSSDEKAQAFQAQRRQQGVAEDTDLAAMLRHAGVPVRESVLTDSTGHTLDHILQRFSREVADFEKGADLDRDLFDALYDYYFDDMPYGVKKARTGDPYEWISERLADELGITESNSGMIMPEADPMATVEAMPDLSAPVLEGTCNATMEGEYCPEHGLAECGMYEMGTVAGGMAPVIGEAPQDPINYNGAITGAYYESKSDTALLARIKSLALLK